MCASLKLLSLTPILAHRSLASFLVWVCVFGKCSVLLFIRGASFLMLLNPSYSIKSFSLIPHCLCAYNCTSHLSWKPFTSDWVSFWRTMRRLPLQAPPTLNSQAFVYFLRVEFSIIATKCFSIWIPATPPLWLLSIYWVSICLSKKWAYNDACPTSWNHCGDQIHWSSEARYLVHTNPTINTNCRSHYLHSRFMNRSL